MADEVTPELTPVQQLQVARAQAVQAAMLEVMQEQQREIIRRASVKLKAMGIIVEDEATDGANI